ncbi:MAG TPA: multidrug efflux SMR transporter [Selenomonadales bacterium]|nr:multidrug efflux SMR transporter [Selenomonadales bacterium]
MSGYILLGIAIVCEIFSTSMLKISAGFTKFLPSLAFAIGMGTSFYTLSRALTFIPLNVAYAIWSGLGTVLTALVAIWVWKESFNIYTGMGIALIIGGVVLLNLKGPGH